MIILDTSGLFALLNRKDQDHRRAKQLFFDDPGPYIVPAGILAEIGYLVEHRLGVRTLLAFLRDLGAGLAVDCGERDFPRILALVERYSDLPLGFSEACVLACAERNGGRVLSFDRDFSIIASKGKLQVAGAD